MFPGKRGLSEQINTAITKKWNKECTDILCRVMAHEAEDIKTESGSFVCSVQNVNLASLTRMKERIEALEDLNDELYQLICCLLENLPDLIVKTIYSNIGADQNPVFNDFQSQFGKIMKSCGAQKMETPLPTRREKDVLELLSKGYCAKEIASQLYISETTVITHKKNLKKKFNVKNTAELIFITNSVKS